MDIRRQRQTGKKEEQKAKETKECKRLTIKRRDDQSEGDIDEMARDHQLRQTEREKYTEKMTEKETGKETNKETVKKTEKEAQTEKGSDNNVIKEIRILREQ